MKRQKQDGVAIKAIREENDYSRSELEAQVASLPDFDITKLDRLVPGTVRNWESGGAVQEPAKVWATYRALREAGKLPRGDLEAVGVALGQIQKGPGEPKEESPNHSQGQDSSARPTAPLKATKLLDDFRSGAAAHMTFKEFSDQVSACVQNPWTFPELSGLWKDLVVAPGESFTRARGANPLLGRKKRT